MLALLDLHWAVRLPGIMHCFSGTQVEVSCLALGFYRSRRYRTFPKSADIQERQACPGQSHSGGD